MRAVVLTWEEPQVAAGDRFSLFLRTDGVAVASGTVPENATRFARRLGLLHALGLGLANSGLRDVH